MFVVPAAALIDAAILGDWMVIDGLFLTGRFDASVGAIWRHVVPGYIALAIWLLCFAMVAALWQGDATVIRHRGLWRIASLLLVGPLLAGCSWIYWHMLVGPQPEAEQWPEENVYPRILEIASNLEGATPREAAEVYAQIIPLLSQPGHAVLDWGGPCREPVQRLVAYEQRKMKVLVWGLEAESARCRTMDRPDEAARYAEAALRLSRMAARGGIMADSMAADANRKNLAEIAAMRRTASTATALRLSRLIESLENERESPEAILAREARFRFVNEGWRYRLLHAIWVDLFKFESVPDPYASLVKPWSQQFACLARMLSIDLALRAYRADQGAWPDALEQLVPIYLEAIPADPFAGNGWVYRAGEPEFVLYSTGSDGRDDGGQFGNVVQLSRDARANRGFDLDIDTLTRP